MDYTFVIGELCNVVENFFGYRARKEFIKRDEQEVGYMLYDSFVLHCGIGDRYGTFSCYLGNGDKDIKTISTFLNKTCSLNSDRQSITESLHIIDEYCRLRLPDKFLKAFDEAYKRV